MNTIYESLWARAPGQLLGVPVGAAGLLASLLGHNVIPGRLLGDPLPLALAFGGLLRNRLYFDWRSPLLVIAFVTALGVLSVWLARRYGARQPLPLKTLAEQTAQTAAIINVGFVALREIDAIVVAFWYLIAGFLAVMIATTVASQLSRRWRTALYENGELIDPQHIVHKAGDTG